MYCPECGAEIKNDNFCSECGTHLKQPHTPLNKIREENNSEETPMFCLSCKSPLPGRPTHCPGCGKRMRYPDKSKKAIKMKNKDKFMLIPRILGGGFALLIGIVLILVIWAIISFLFLFIISIMMGLPNATPDWIYWVSGILGALTTIGIASFMMRGD